MQTLSSSRSSPSSSSNSPLRTLKTNPNGEIYYRGIANSGKPTRYRSPNFGSPTKSPNKSSNSDSAEGKQSSAMDARHTLWSTPRAVPSPIPSSKNSPTASTNVMVASAASGRSPPKRSKYAATVEDASDDDAPPTTPLASTIPSSQPQPSSELKAPIFTSQSISKVSGSPASQLRNSYGPRRPSPLRQTTRLGSSSSSPPQPRTSCTNAASTPMAYNIMSDIIKEATASTVPPPKPKFVSRLSQEINRQAHQETFRMSVTLTSVLVMSVNCLLER